MKKTLLTALSALYILSCSAHSATDVLDTNYTPNHDFSLLPHEAAKELCLDDALTIIDRTITPVGPWALKELTYPTTNIPSIQQRQRVLKHLINDEQSYASIEASLRTVSPLLNDLLAYWNNADVLNVESKALYFNISSEVEPGTQPSRLQRVNSYLNASPLALECGPFIGVGLLVGQYAIQRAVSAVGLEFVRRAKESTLPNPPAKPSALQCIWQGLTKTITGPIIAHLPGLHLFKNRLAPAPTNPRDLAGAKAYLEDKNFREAEVNTYGSNLSIADRAKHFELDCSIPTKYHSNYLCSIGYTAVYDVVAAFLVYQQVKSLNESNNTINKLRTRLTHTATIIKEAEKLYNSCSQNLSELPAIKAIGNFIANKSEKLQELIQLLHSPTFTGEQSFFYRRGRVLFAHRVLCALKNELLPLLRAIAEVDAYLSMARLYKEHQVKNNRYCFVTFDTANKHPRALLTNFWSPLVTVQEPVLNTLIIGNQRSESLLLAGPNGCGKSTFMKAVAYSWALLPLSWGISTADQAVITPLTHIRTAINIQEDPHHGLSTYMAQKKRFDAVCDLVKNQKPHHRTLLCIDEPLSGTVEAEAADQTTKLGEEIGAANTLCAFIATHLELPTHLDEITGAFTNYYPEVIELNGYFKQTYKLLPGKADWWFKDRAKRSRFLGWLSTRIA